MTAPTLRALLEKVIQTESTCSGDIDNEDWHTPAVHAFISARGSLEIAAINALPQLLAIAEKAKAVVWYDCSDNDSDFVADVEALRQALTAPAPTQPEARQ